MEDVLASILVGVMGITGLVLFVGLVVCIIYETRHDDYWN